MCIKKFVALFFSVLLILQQSCAHTVAWGYIAGNLQADGTSDVTIYSGTYHPYNVASYGITSTEGKLLISSAVAGAADTVYNWDGFSSYSDVSSQLVGGINWFYGSNSAFQICSTYTACSAPQVQAVQYKTISNFAPGDYFLIYDPSSVFSNHFKPYTTITAGFYISIFTDPVASAAYTGERFHISYPAGVTAPPTVVSTIATSKNPSLVPSAAPSEVPTLEPSQAPTVTPSEAPTVEPTIEPSNAPTFMPSFEPTDVPTMSPSTPKALKPKYKTKKPKTKKSKGERRA